MSLDEQKMIEQGLAYARRIGLSPQALKAGLIADLGFFEIYCRGVNFGEGRSGFQIILEQAPNLSPGAAVLAKHKGKIVLIETFRHTVNQTVIEIPRGFSDKNETPEQTAKREFFEETNLICNSVIQIGHLHPNTGYSAEEIPLFTAIAEGIPRPQKEESIKRVLLVSVDEFGALISTNKIKDAFTLAAFAKASLIGWL